MLSFLRGGNKRTKTIWWVLIFVTVITFLGGFVFLLGSGLDSTNRARMSGAIGTIDGKPISRTEFQLAMDEQRENYRRQNATDPGSHDQRAVELLAWRSLVVEKLLSQQADKLGLDAYDHEVVVKLRTNPPPSVTASPTFQTNGKFDFEKYQAALNDPNNLSQVAMLEEQTRRRLPMQKLQERLVSSVKVAEPELVDFYHQRFDRVNGAVVFVPPADGEAPAPADADVKRVYEKYKNRFAAGARTQAEVLRVPKDFGEDEIRVSRDLANSLVRRARGGESFAVLARDYSESPEAERGGEIDRILAPNEFGAELGPKIAVLDTGGVTDPILDGGSFRIFKVLQKDVPNPNTGGTGVKVAQIVVDLKGNEGRLRTQYETLAKLRQQAVRTGLGKAAAAKGLPTATTGPFDNNNTPPELMGVPEAADWALASKQGAVSPVFTGNDEYLILQVSNQHPAGPAKQEELTEQLRQIAQLDARVERNKPKADAIANALKSGATLEQAAAAAGVPESKIANMTRVQPDPQLNGAPEVVGALFGARPGQVVGPIRLLNGWYFVRVDDRQVADEKMFQQIKEQFSSELLQQRQRAFLLNFLNQLRTGATVKDLRNEPS